MKVFIVLLFELLLTVCLSESSSGLTHAELSDTEFGDLEMEFDSLAEEGFLEHEQARLLGGKRCMTIYRSANGIRRPRYLHHNGIQYRRLKATCQESYNKAVSYDVDWTGDCKFDTESCSVVSGHTVECRLGVSRERHGCRVKYVDALLKVKCCQ